MRERASALNERPMRERASALNEWQCSCAPGSSRPTLAGSAGVTPACMDLESMLIFPIDPPRSFRFYLRQGPRARGNVLDGDPECRIRRARVQSQTAATLPPARARESHSIVRPYSR